MLNAMSRRFQLNLRGLFPRHWRELERWKVPETLLLLGVAIAVLAGMAEPGTSKRVLMSLAFVIGLCSMLLLRRP